MNKTTFMAKPGQVERKWYVVDATDVPLGRLSAVVASVLRGKNKPTFTPHTVTGDFVIVINAEKGKLTGKKGNDKTTSKELNIYTWTYFIPQKVIDDFQKETGIKVNLSYYDSNDVMMTKLMSGAKGFDIISPSTDYVDILIKTGLIEKLDKTKLKEVLDPKNFIGFAPIQTEEFVQQEIQPVLEKYADLIGLESELKV